MIILFWIVVVGIAVIVLLVICALLDKKAKEPAIVEGILGAEKQLLIITGSGKDGWISS